MADRQQLRDRFVSAWSRWEAHRLRGSATASHADATRDAAGRMFAAEAFDPTVEIALRSLDVARAAFAAAWPMLCNAWLSNDGAAEAGHKIEIGFAELERALKVPHKTKKAASP